MLRRRGAYVAAVAAVAAFSGCSGSGSGGPAAGPTGLPVATTPPACPTPANSKAPKWPITVPHDLPKPPNARILDHTTAGDGVDILKFTTPTSLRESVIFVVEKLPKAGYELGRGDAEANEADAPFLHGNVRGLMRMLEIGQCQTEWLLATVSSQAPTGTSPLLPAHTPSGSPSPLPFG